MNFSFRLVLTAIFAIALATMYSRAENTDVSSAATSVQPSAVHVSYSEK